MDSCVIQSIGRLPFIRAVDNLSQNLIGVVFQLTQNLGKHFELNKTISRFRLIGKVEARVVENADYPVKKLEI